MRTVRGSMMDAAGSRPTDLAHALGSVVAATLPDAQHPRRAPLQLVPASRALAAQSLVAHLASSQSNQAWQAAAALPVLAFDVAGTQQALALAGAVMQQWMSLQAQWLQGLTDLAQEMGEIRQVNTVSKYVDQEMNLVQQGLDLVSNQAAATARLAENIQVNMAWWLHQRTAQKIHAAA
jgi:hypothetical protein